MNRPYATPKAPEQMPQELIDAIMEFISKKYNGKIEINFFQGGIGKITGTPTINYK